MAATQIPNTLAAAGDFQVVEGPLGSRLYNPLPGLPSTQFPEGTLIRNVAGEIVQAMADNTWKAVGDLLVVANPGQWAGAAPTSKKAAIDRLAALLYDLTDDTPIP